MIKAEKLASKFEIDTMNSTIEHKIKSKLDNVNIEDISESSKERMWGAIQKATITPSTEAQIASSIGKQTVETIAKQNIFQTVTAKSILVSSVVIFAVAYYFITNESGNENIQVPTVVTQTNETAVEIETEQPLDKPVSNNENVSDANEANEPATITPEIPSGGNTVEIDKVDLTETNSNITSEVSNVQTATVIEPRSVTVSVEQNTTTPDVQNEILEGVSNTITDQSEIENITEAKNKAVDDVEPKQSTPKKVIIPITEEKIIKKRVRPGKQPKR